MKPTTDVPHSCTTEHNCTTTEQATAGSLPTNQRRSDPHATWPTQEQRGANGWRLCDKRRHSQAMREQSTECRHRNECG